MDNIQWYPGHMAKTKKLILENMKIVDVVIELLDARIPFSSKNPDIDAFSRGKRKIVLLNKADLADDCANKLWQDYYEKAGNKVVLGNSLKGVGIDKLTNLSYELMDEKIKKQKERGRMFIPIRAMIVGIPNVGKSTLINKWVGKSVAKAADKPGVTRGKQWIKIKQDFELLDMPGILWPRFDNERVGLNLACTGAINDNITSSEHLAQKLLSILMEVSPNAVFSRYQVDVSGLSGEEALDIIAKKRGFILKGQKIDCKRAAVCVLDEFRGGKLGRITLEKPNSN